MRALFASPEVGSQYAVWVHGDLGNNTYNQDFQAATTHEDISV